MGAGRGMKTGLVSLFVVPAIALVAGGWWLLADRQSRDVRLGQQLYQENCASCHGANLEGQANWKTPDENGILPAPPHDETGHTWHHGDRLLFGYIKLGGAAAMKRAGFDGFKSGMPGFGNVLSDQEIGQTLAYIKSNWPEKLQSLQEQSTKTEAESNG
ncbi:c-type cytochrome [Profundibacter sp.]